MLEWRCSCSCLRSFVRIANALMRVDCRGSLERAPRSPLFASPDIQAELELAGPLPPYLFEKVSYLNVIVLRQDCAVHRWRQSLRDSQDARFRHRLQAPAQGIPKSRNPAARVLLHGDHRRSGILVDPPLDRLARL